MRGQWMYFGGALVIALGVAGGPLEAQRGLGGRGGGFPGPAGPNMGNSVAVAIEHQEELGLSGEQVAQLKEVKAVMDGEISGLVEEMNTLREGIRSGDVDRDEGFRQMGALRGELITASTPLRGRVQEILTVDQHNRLQPMVRAGRPGMGRGNGVRSVRGGVGARPMIRGQARVPRAMGRAQGMRSSRPMRNPVNFRRGIGGDLPGSQGEGWNLP